MSLPATDNFTGTPGESINGRTTTTGGLTWAAAVGTTIETANFGGSGQVAHVGRALLEAGTADVIISIKMDLTASFPLIYLRADDATTPTVYLYVNWSFSEIHVYNQASAEQGPGATGLTIADGDTISVEANGTAIEVKQNGVSRYTTTSSNGLTNTVHGIGAVNAYFDDFSIDAFAIASPTATFDHADETTIYLTSTAGAGGSSPQWSRSNTAFSGYSNLSNGGGVSGATSVDLVDGSVTPGVRYYYKVTYAVTGDSNVQGAVTNRKPAYVLVIGDSIDVGSGVDSPYVTWEQAVRTVAGVRDSLYVNWAVGGANTAIWYDATDVGSEVQVRLSDASADGLSEGCTTAIIDLGTNDAFSITPAEFKANLLGIANYLLGEGYEKVIINYPPAIPQVGGSGAQDNLQAMLAKIDECDNGTTILVGDKTAFDYFLCYRSTELEDGGTGVHPDASGTIQLGYARAVGWVRAVDPSAFALRGSVAGPFIHSGAGRAANY